MADITPVQEARMKQIDEIVQRAGATGATISEIAKALPVAADQKPIKVTPYLLGLLDKCVEVGWLRKEQSYFQTGRGLRMGWRYYAVLESQS